MILSDLPQWLQITIQIVGGITAVAVPLFFALKPFLERYINNRVDAKFATDLETHKNALQIEAKDREIRLSKLREIQTPIFETLYKKLVIVHDSAYTCVLEKHGTDTYNEKLKEFHTLINESRQYFERHKIYFREEMCSNVNRLYLALLASYAKLSEDKQYDPLAQKANIKQVWEWITNDSDNLMKLIEKEFRAIMGV